LRDSIPFVVTTPAAAFPSIAIRVPVGSTTPIAVFSPDSVVIAPGGMVQWSNPTATPVDIVFDNPAAATEAPFNPSGDGNIAAFKADSQPVSRARVFLQAGVYPFHSALNGTSGKVVVRSYP
jgi:plastocyanin